LNEPPSGASDYGNAMKRIALLLLVALAGLGAPADARVQVSFDFFYESLSPYGEWVSAGDYGPVWHPAGVDDDWTPYSDGYWAYTDAGWTWVSYEDWGGITYHYGRWVRVGGYGWCWVPDYEWGPAWVSWRRSDDYVGWAPLPPEARWTRDTGFSIWVDTEFDIGPAWFRFCHVRDFGAPFIRPVLLPWHRNYVIINQTYNITNISYRRDFGCVFNQGPDYRWLAPLTARPVPALKLVRHTDDVFVPGARGRVFINAPRGNTLVVAAPAAVAGAAVAPRKSLSLAKSFPSPRIDRGWTAPPTGAPLDSIRAAFKHQAAGATPKTAPARPFQPGLVTVVPKKADLKAKVVSLGRALAVQPSQPQPAGAAATIVPPAPSTLPAAGMSRRGPTDAGAQRLQPGAAPASPLPPIAGPQPAKPDATPGIRQKGRGTKLPEPIAASPSVARPVVTPPAAPETPPVQVPAPVVNRLKPGKGIQRGTPGIPVAPPVQQPVVTAPAAPSAPSVQAPIPGARRSPARGIQPATPKLPTSPSAPPVIATPKAVTPAAPRVSPPARSESRRAAPAPIAQRPQAVPDGNAIRRQMDAHRAQQQNAAAAAAARPPVAVPTVPTGPVQIPNRFGRPTPAVPPSGIPTGDGRFRKRQ
jgi:hypothetical protein